MPPFSFAPLNLCNVSPKTCWYYHGLILLFILTLYVLISAFLLCDKLFIGGVTSNYLKNGNDWLNGVHQDGMFRIPSEPDQWNVDFIDQTVRKMVLGHNEFVVRKKNHQKKMDLKVFGALERCPVTAQVELDLSWCRRTTRHDTEADFRYNALNENVNFRCPYLLLTTFDGQGNDKTMGGDEFYITFFSALNLDQRNNRTKDSPHSPDAVGHVFDNDDGTYRVYWYDSTAWMMTQHWPEGARQYGNISDYFFNNNPPSQGLSPSRNRTENMVEPSYGRIEVVLEYSCGVGSFYTPLKENWTNPGALNQVYTSPYFLLDQFPLVHPLERPSTTFAESFYQNYDLVIGLGDSIMRQWFEAATTVNEVGASKDGDHEEFSKEHVRSEHEKQSNNSSTTNEMYNRLILPAFSPRRPINSFYVKRGERWRKRLETTLQRSMERFRSSANNSTTAQARFALIINSMAWDILSDDMNLQGENFKDHTRALVKFLDHIFDTYVNLKQNASSSHNFTLDVFWKSATALHVHQARSVLRNQSNLAASHRLLYCSESRSRYLYSVQRELIELYNKERLKDSNSSQNNNSDTGVVPVTFLDHYNITYNAAEWHRRNDAVHYTDAFNKFLIAMYFDVLT